MPPLAASHVVKPKHSSSPGMSYAWQSVSVVAPGAGMPREHSSHARLHPSCLQHATVPGLLPQVELLAKRMTSLRQPGASAPEPIASAMTARTQRRCGARVVKLAQGQATRTAPITAAVAAALPGSRLQPEAAARDGASSATANPTAASVAQPLNHFPVRSIVIAPPSRRQPLCRTRRVPSSQN